MNKKLIGALAFSTLLAGSISVGVVACNNEGEEDQETAKSCTSKLECKLGETCEAGKCVAITGCDPAIEDSCAAGQYCNDLGECASCGDAAKSCEFVGMNGQVNTGLVLAAGSTVELKAVALDVNHTPVYCADMEFKAGSKVIENGKYTAAEGDTKLTATVKGTSVSCDADVVVKGAVDEGKVRVYVYDDNSGKPVEGALVIINNGVDKGVATGADGFAVVDASSDEAEDYVVTAVKDGYNFVSFAGLKKSTNDVAIPVGARPRDGVKVGGSQGKFDFEKFSQFVNEKKNFRAAFMLNSIPLSSLFSYDIEHFIDMNDLRVDCGSNPTADGCYSLDGMIPSTLTSMLRNVNLPSALPLPGGVVVSGDAGAMKDSYTAAAMPGKRIPWGLGIEFSINDVLSLAGLATPFLGGSASLKDLDVPAIADQALPFLFGKLGSSVGFVGDMPAKDSKADYTKQDLSLDEKMRIYRQVKIESLPTDAKTNKPMDAVAAVRFSNAQGYGAVVTGLAVAADLNQDGKIDARKVCNNTATMPDCPQGVSGDVPENNLGMLYAPARGAIKNADDMTVYVTSSIGEALAAVKNPSNLDYGDLRILASIKKGAPTNKDVIKASDFIGATTASSDFSTITLGAGSNMTIDMMSFGSRIGKASYRWLVYTNKSEISGNSMPNIQDFMDGTDSDDTTVSFVSFKLSDNLGMDDLAKNNGLNVDRVFENADALSVSVPGVFLTSGLLK